jgi:hypothetical protein
MEKFGDQRTGVKPTETWRPVLTKDETLVVQDLKINLLRFGGGGATLKRMDEKKICTGNKIIESDELNKVRHDKSFLGEFSSGDWFWDRDSKTRTMGIVIVDRADVIITTAEFISRVSKLELTPAEGELERLTNQDTEMVAIRFNIRNSWYHAHGGDIRVGAPVGVMTCAESQLRQGETSTS